MFRRDLVIVLNMRNMKYFLSLLAVTVSAWSCLGDTAVIASKFDRLVPVELSAGALRALSQRHIDTDAILKMPKPKDWTVLWKDYPADCRLYECGSHWAVSTSGRLPIYHNEIINCISRNYLLKIEATADDAYPADSHIEICVERYGMLVNGICTLKELTVKRKESVSFDIPMRFDPGVPFFRVVLKISGNVILKKLVLEEMPDDLVESGITLVEGTLKEISQIPNPQKSDYADCRFTALFDGESIIAGAPCAKKMQLVLDGFINYKLLATSGLKPGDKIRCFIIPFDKLSDAMKGVQQADDLNLFELPNYYVQAIARVSAFSQNSSIPFAEIQEYISVFDRKINPPLSEEEKKTQRLAIEESLQKINRTLAPYSDERELKMLNSRFTQAWNAEKAKDPAGHNRCGKGNIFVWRRIDDSFWVLPQSYDLIPRYWILPQDNLKALLALQEFLNANGCQLIIGIVPDLFAIAARVINREFRAVPDFGTAWLVQQLLNNNLEAVYASDELLKGYNRHQFAFFYPDNGHPADTTQDILTDIFADLLRRYHFRETLEQERFSIDKHPHALVKLNLYPFPENCDIGSNKAGTHFMSNRVLYDGKEVFQDPKSPILVVGNSYMQSPMDYPNSFTSLLASKMHMGIADYKIKGYGPMTTIISHLFSDPEKFLTGKKVVILILGFGHFRSGTRFNNIRTMDKELLLLSGKAPKATITIHGNGSPIPNRFKRLNNARCFIIPQKGKCLVVDKSMRQGGATRVLVIPACAHSPCPAKLKVNGTVLAIPESFAVYNWNRIVVPLPEETEHLTIELEGKPGTEIILGDIQIFQ